MPEENETARKLQRQVDVLERRNAWLLEQKDGLRCEDPVVESVREDLLARSNIGMAKYGVTLARTDLTLRDWLQHAYEEALDLANYLKRAIKEIDDGN